MRLSVIIAGVNCAGFDQLDAKDPKSGLGWVNFWHYIVQFEFEHLFHP